MAVFDGMSDEQDPTDAIVKSAGQQHIVVLHFQNANREACLQSLAVLEALPGIRRVLLDEAGDVVLAGATNNGKPRQGEVTSRTRRAAVSLLATGESHLKKAFAD